MSELTKLKTLRETIKLNRLTVAFALKKQKWIKEVFETEGDLILVKFWDGTHLTLKVSGGWEKLDPIWKHETLKESEQEYADRITRNKEQNYGDKN